MKKDAQATHLERFSRWKTYLVLLILLLVMTIILSLNLGFSQISFLDILKILIRNVPFIGNFVHFSNATVVEEIIIIQIRLPRILSGALVGAALAAAGVIYQAGIPRSHSQVDLHWIIICSHRRNHWILPAT